MSAENEQLRKELARARELEDSAKSVTRSVQNDNERLRTKINQLRRRIIRDCKRCNGLGFYHQSSLSMHGPHDVSQKRSCPACADVRAALEKELG